MFIVAFVKYDIFSKKMLLSGWRDGSAVEKIAIM